MINYREILRLGTLKYSQRTIEAMVRCSRHTVREVLQSAKVCGISWPLSDDVTNADLERLLFPNKHKAVSEYTEPDYSYIHRELARPGVTLTLLWKEYYAKCHESGQKPYMSTQFGERYRRWAPYYKGNHAYPTQTRRCHTGGLGWRYYSHPGPSQQLLHLCRNMQ